MGQLVINGKNVTIECEGDAGGSIVESVAADGGARAVVMFKCAYADRFDVYKGLMGTSLKVGSSIVRTRPLAYPPSPNLYCMEIGESQGIKPRVDASGWLYYKDVVFPAIFTTPTYQFDAASPDGQNDPSGKPYTTTTTSISVEVLTPPDGAYFIGPFPGGKKVEEASIGIIRPAVEITMKRHFLPYVPFYEAFHSVGTVNASPLRFGNLIFDTGQLLFAGMESEPNNDPGGNPTQEITYKLVGKGNDWNRFVSKDGTFQYLNSLASGAGNPPYTYFDYWAILP